MTFDAKLAETRLKARRAEIEHLREISTEARKTVALDQQSVGRLSRMDALQGQAMAQATERKRLAELQRIERALKALDTGEYGLCVTCGEEIGDKRLELDPSALVCMNCMKGGKRSA